MSAEQKALGDDVVTVSYPDADVARVQEAISVVFALTPIEFLWVAEAIERAIHGQHVVKGSVPS